MTSESISEMRRASNFFKSYHLYENRFPQKNGKELAKKTLHHMKMAEYSEIEPVEIPFKPDGRFGWNFGEFKNNPNDPWKESLHNFDNSKEGWAMSEGDHVCFISGRLVETFLSEQAFALVYMGSNFSRYLSLPSKEDAEQNAKYATLYALDLALKVAIAEKWSSIQVRTDNLAVANLFTFSLPKINESVESDETELTDLNSESANNPKRKQLLDGILKHRANISFNVAYIDPRTRISKQKKRNIDEGIVKLNRLAAEAQRKLVESENLYFSVSELKHEFDN